MTARPIERVCIIGAGNGGKTSAADLALQGCTISLYELPEYAQAAFAGIADDKQLHAQGAVGSARAERSMPLRRE
jgi:2-polyprenyl-6-methoxyphenol hydroxylase-like FAD-dependent oxidoreductase